MPKSKKNCNQQRNNTEKERYVTNAKKKNAVSSNNSNANLQNETPDAIAISTISSSNGVREARNIVACPDRNPNIQSVQCGAIVKMVKKSSRVDIEKVNAETQTPEQMLMNSLEQELVTKIQDMQIQELSFRFKAKQLEHQKKELEMKAQKQITLLRTSLTAQFKQYFTFQKKIIEDHINNCKKMVTDLAAALAYLSYLSLNDILTIADCRQNYDQWTLELQKAEECWNLFEKIQRQVFNNLCLGNFSALPELPPLLNQLHSKPADILHDHFVLAINSGLRKQRESASLMNNTWWSTWGTNQQLPSATSSSATLPNLSEALASTKINAETSKEQAPYSSSVSEFETFASTKVNAETNKEQAPYSPSVSEFESKETQNENLFDKNWLKKIRRIHANSPADVEQDIQNDVKDVPSRSACKDVPSRLACNIDDDLDNTWLKKIRRIHSNCSNIGKQDTLNWKKDSPSGSAYGELHKLNQVYLDKSNLEKLQADIEDNSKNNYPTTRWCSSVSGHSIHELAESMDGINFYNLYIYVRERIPKTLEVEVLRALKAVQQKRSRLSGMAKDDIVAAVQAEISTTEIQESERECVICLQPYGESPTTTMQCLHSFHVDCLKWWLSKDPVCPLCRQHVSPNEEAFNLLGDVESLPKRKLF